MKQGKETGRIGKGERTNRCHWEEGNQVRWEEALSLVFFQV